MADRRISVAVAPLRSTSVAVRLTEGQRYYLEQYALDFAAENPDKSYRVLNAEGSPNLSAVVRQILGETIDGFAQA